MTSVIFHVGEQPDRIMLSFDQISPDLDYLVSSEIFQPTVETRRYSVLSHVGDDLSVQNNAGYVSGIEEVFCHLLYLFDNNGPSMCDRVVCVDHLDKLYTAQVNEGGEFVDPGYSNEEWNFFFDSYSRCARWLSTKVRLVLGKGGRVIYKVAMVTRGNRCIFHRSDIR